MIITISINYLDYSKFTCYIHESVNDVKFESNVYVIPFSNFVKF